MLSGHVKNERLTQNNLKVFIKINSFSNTTNREIVTKTSCCIENCHAPSTKWIVQLIFFRKFRIDWLIECLRSFQLQIVYNTGCKLAKIKILTSKCTNKRDSYWFFVVAFSVGPHEAPPGSFIHFSVAANQETEKDTLLLRQQYLLISHGDQTTNIEHIWQTWLLINQISTNRFEDRGIEREGVKFWRQQTSNSWLNVFSI